MKLEQEVKIQLEAVQTETARIMEQNTRFQHDLEDKDKEVLRLLT